MDFAEAIHQALSDLSGREALHRFAQTDELGVPDEAIGFLETGQEALEETNSSG